jgi:hypothetical protein
MWGLSGKPMDPVCIRSPFPSQPRVYHFLGWFVSRYSGAFTSPTPLGRIGQIVKCLQIPRAASCAPQPQPHGICGPRASQCDLKSGSAARVRHGYALRTCGTCLMYIGDNTNWLRARPALGSQQMEALSVAGFFTLHFRSTNADKWAAFRVQPALRAVESHRCATGRCGRASVRDVSRSHAHGADPAVRASVAFAICGAAARPLRAGQTASPAAGGRRGRAHGSSLSRVAWARVPAGTRSRARVRIPRSTHPHGAVVDLGAEHDVSEVRTMAFAGIGVAIGLAFAYVATRLIQAHLFGIVRD